ncbi:MAG: aminotransferase class III-fold pyridoxal phosphate-dependent enzyme [Desulfobacterales bacterium]|nr:aminotransferase class III-fold pyridoxal phosphate-dependent enzyme [Desulfobacterales bacterium]
MYRSERHLIFKDFSTHISRGQIRYLAAGHLDILEQKRKGTGFREAVSGRRFIDGFSSAGCFNVGRGNHGIIRALTDGLEDIDMGSPDLLSPARTAFAIKLAAACPGDLNRVVFAGSGADAIEAALKLARGATGREKIISMEKAYHGHSGFSLSANGKDYYKDLFQPLIPGFPLAPFGDLEALARLIDDQTAAIILEPIQGEGGIHVANDNYLAGLRELCDTHGTLLIFDEIQTGFGRTGRLWASEHSGVVPDLMVLAKSIGGGVYPNAAVVHRDIPLLTDFREANPGFHRSSGGGTPLGCQVSSAVLDYLTENNVCENAAAMGKRMIRGLEALQDKYPAIIREVRGRGMMIGIEYGEEYMGVLMADCLARNGMFAVYSGNAPQVMRFQLPLTASADEIDHAIVTVEKAIRLMRLYLRLLSPVTVFPAGRRLLNNQSFLVAVNNILRWFEIPR